MTPIQELYEILETMLHFMEENDRDTVSELNKDFSKLFRNVFPINTTADLGRLYDNCRQSCVTGEMVEDSHESLLKEAIRLFSQIPKP